MEFAESFLGRDGYVPCGACFTWSPTLLWSMVLAVAAVAYFSIPLVIVVYFRLATRFVAARRRPPVQPFISACSIRDQYSGTRIGRTTEAIGNGCDGSGVASGSGPRK